MSKNIFYSLFKMFLLINIVLLLYACQSMPVDDSQMQKQVSTSSLVAYLYPDGRRPPKYKHEVPLIKVPARIGIAFVPASRNSKYINNEFKQAILRKVRNSFRDNEVVSSIRIIPQYSVTPGGGFRDLERLASRYQLDLIALVSHNQVGGIKNNAMSLTYWTIIGALVLPGNNHQVRTYIDTAVFDVNTRKLLFRASGSDRAHRQSSAVGINEKHGFMSKLSLVNASNDMISSLEYELRKFRSRVRQGSGEADVLYSERYRGEKPEADREFHYPQSNQAGRQNRNY